jgi:hypothetical protein
MLRNLLNLFNTNKNKNLEEKRQDVTLKESIANETISSTKPIEKTLSNENYILVDGKKLSVDFEVVQSPLPNNCFQKVSKKRNPNVLVTHWDVALSANSCFRILSRLKISTHFCIDNDGKVFQFVDTNNVAWHAGPTQVDRNLFPNRKLPSWNSNSIGIDFSNAYYLKYQKDYVKAGFGERPVIESRVHNVKLGPHLGFYPAQIESYKKLVNFLCDVYNIPKVCPFPLNTICEEAVNGKFKGVINHFNLTRNKIDCAGLPLDKILEDIRGDK